jgi:hypothetical protein
MHVDTPQALCKFGIAHAEVTPPVGIYHRMWGAATHERATGVHRPLRATAFTLQAADAIPGVDAEQVVIALDHCLLWDREMSVFLETVSHATGVARGQISVAFSHTHGAGLMGLERATLPGGALIAPYLDRLATESARLVKQAREKAQPAAIVYGSGRCTLAAHRDFWDEENKQFVCGYNPGAPAEDAVLVARVTAQSGQLLATIVNYACHPTTLAWENTLISPDYPGAMREVVEQATGAPCVFLQGASGDLGPREGFVGDPAVADRNGRELGYAALAALETLPKAGTRFRYTGPVISGATLGAWAHVPLSENELAEKRRWRVRRWALDLAYRPGLPTVEGTRAERARWLETERNAERQGKAIEARDAHAMVERMDRQLNRLAVLPTGPIYPLAMACWQLGDAFWLAVESEHYQVLQRAVREAFPGTPIVVMTIVNGSRAAYLPSADVYDKGIYQESIALLAAGCLEKVIDAAVQQIRSWQ